MLQVSHLSKTFGAQVVFDDASFTVNRGERVGLVGRNGSGKTTLFRLVLGDERVDAGEISVPRGYTVGHLSQHLRFAADTVLQEACSSLPASEDGRDESYRAEAVLLGLGFTGEDFRRSPHELSGGYQVRLNLAKVLVAEPNLLLLDEPTNYLDILSVRWLARFLTNWKNEFILITHDRAFMDGVTTHTLGLHRMNIRKVAGPTQKLYDQIIREEEVYEQTRINDEKARQQAEQFINRFRAQATKARAVQSRIKALERRERLEKQEEAKTLDFRFLAAPFSAKRLLQAEDLSFSYAPDGPRLIDRLSFSVAKSDRIAVIGKNGKGKTTLLNLLAGELKPAGGSVKLHPNTRSSSFGQTNIDRLNPEKTVLDEIRDVHPDRSHTAARSIAGLMLFEGDNALKKVSVLSGGERSRVLLGKLLVSPANLLLLDEPTNHLDMESIDSLIEAIETFDGAVLIVTHSELILRALATKLIVFDAGRASLFEGTYRDFIERVGWRDEAAGASPGVAPGCSPEKNVNRRDLRRLRAELVAERSKILAPLQTRIAELEETITRLEQEVHENTRALVEASERGDARSIRDRSLAVREAERTIERLFAELEALTAEHDEKTREFERRLSELQG